MIPREKALRLWLPLALLVPLLSVTGRPLLRWLDGWLSRSALGWWLGAALVLALAWAVWRLRRYRPAVAAAMAVVAVLALAWVPRGEERLHLLLFGLLGYLGVAALGPAWSLAACWALAAGDEGLQAFLPDRVADWRDVVMNAAAAGVGYLLALGALRR